MTFYTPSLESQLKSKGKEAVRCLLAQDYEGAGRCIREYNEIRVEIREAEDNRIRDLIKSAFREEIY